MNIIGVYIGLDSVCLMWKEKTVLVKKENFSYDDLEEKSVANICAYAFSLLDNFIKSNRIKKFKINIVLFNDNENVITNFLYLRGIDKKSINNAVLIELESLYMDKNISDYFVKWDILKQDRNDYYIIASMINKEMVEYFKLFTKYEKHIKSVITQSSLLKGNFVGTSVVVNLADNLFEMYLITDDIPIGVSRVDIGDGNKIQKLVKESKQYIRTSELKYKINIPELHFKGEDESVISSVAEDLGKNYSLLDEYFYVDEGIKKVVKKEKQNTGIDFKSMLITRDKKEINQFAIFLISAAILFWAVSYFINVKIDENIEEIRGKVESINSEVNKVQSSMSSVQNEIRQLESTKKVLDIFSTDNTSCMFYYMDMIATNMPKNMVVDILTLCSDEIRIRGAALNYSDIGAFIICLEDEESFSSIELLDVSENTGRAKAGLRYEIGIKVVNNARGYEVNGGGSWGQDRDWSMFNREEFRGSSGEDSEDSGGDSGEGVGDSSGEDGGGSPNIERHNQNGPEIE